MIDILDLSVAVSDDTAATPAVNFLSIYDNLTNTTTNLTTSRSGNTLTVTGPTTLNVAGFDGTATVSVEDDAGNVAEVSIPVYSDITPPVAAVKYDGIAFSGGDVSDVSLLEFDLTDNLDSTPTLLSAKIGTTDLVIVQSGNNYTITGPTSLNTLEVATSLTISAEDDLGNVSNQEIPINYR